jgi:hypothetical protein
MGMRFASLIVILVCGCSHVRPLTHAEYGLDSFKSKSSRAVTSQYAFAAVGTRVKAGPVTIDVLAGPLAAWDDVGGHGEGVLVNPGLSWSPVKGTTILFDMEYAVYDSPEYESGFFGFLSISKEW